MQHTLISALSDVIHMHLFPHSTINIALHVLSLDGSLLAALINASTLALIDAGIPMSDYLTSCTAGLTSSTTNSTPQVKTQSAIPGLNNLGADEDVDDPLLDLNGLEEQELPYLTVATLGEGEK